MCYSASSSALTHHDLVAHPYMVNPITGVICHQFFLFTGCRLFLDSPFYLSQCYALNMSYVSIYVFVLPSKAIECDRIENKGAYEVGSVVSIQSALNC